MTTFRVAQRRRFTTIDREALNDEHLSFRARGILAWLLDKPDDWRTSADAIQRAGTEGRDAVRSALRELEDRGYLVRTKIQNAAGQWTTETVIYERPGQPEDGIPGAGFLDVGEPGPLTKTDVPKTETEYPPTPQGGLEAVDMRFEDFWEHYRCAANRCENSPGSKADARHVWKGMKVAEREAALEGIGRHLTQIHDTPNVFALPAAQLYLKRGRYIDEEPKQKPKIHTAPSHPGIDALRVLREARQS